MFEKFRKKKQSGLEIIQEESNTDKSKVEEIKKVAENMDEPKIQEHEKYYSNEGFWNKVQKFAKKAGSTVVYAVLILYYTLQKPDIPLKVKATIAGALGYFIFPIDLIPDVTLGVGFVDDLGVITAALFQVAMYIDEDIKKLAKDKLKDWFGEDVDTSEIDDKLK